MAMPIAGLFAEGETVGEDCECIETSYPGFTDTLDLVLSASVSSTPPTAVLSDARQFLPPDPAAKRAARRKKND